MVKKHHESYQQKCNKSYTRSSLSVDLWTGLSKHTNKQKTTPPQKKKKKTTKKPKTKQNKQQQKKKINNNNEQQQQQQQQPKKQQLATTKNPTCVSLENTAISGAILYDLVSQLIGVLSPVSH